MNRNMICIGCPMGCDLTVTIENGKAVSVIGNGCAVGKRYAETEVCSPTRMVTSTAKTTDGMPVPVKTRIPVPKDKIFDVIAAIKSVTVTLPISVGDVVIENAAGTGIEIVATASKQAHGSSFDKGL